MDGADFSAHLRRTARPATAARRLLWLRSYAATALAWRQISAEVCRRIEDLRPPRRQLLAPQALTAQEARAALRAVEQRGTPRDRAIVYTLLLTGIRVGELAGLDRGDVVLKPRSGSMHIRAEVAKGGKERELPLPSLVRLFLQEYLATRKDDSPAPSRASAAA